MSFMQLQIEQGDVYVVETTIGTECIPVDVAGKVDDVSQLRDYCEGDPRSFELLHDQWTGRLSAPGYMDATDWYWAETLAELLDDMESLVEGDDELERELDEMRKAGL